MPFIKIEKIKSGTIGFWEIAENDDFSHANSIFKLYHPNWLDYKNIQRRQQILATRLLADKMCPNVEIFQNNFGKPYFKNKNKHLSISNDKNIIVLYLSNQPCGIDIQSSNKKVLNIAYKFHNKNDFAADSNEEELIHLWCAKESIYKIHGKPEILFKNHITILNKKEDNRFYGTCSHPNYSFTCRINKLKIKNYCLVYTSDFENSINESKT
jgi:phosphopantetheinyl transferase